MPERIEIQVEDYGCVTGLVYAPGAGVRGGTTILLGHGAGAGQTSDFMVRFAQGIADRGITAVTFNFLYTEQGRRVPDRTDRLERCYIAAVAAVRQTVSRNSDKLAIGGKSMGGRIASQAAALQIEGPSALVFLGYPLHPPGKPDQVRDRHLSEIHLPMLFVQGSRDPFGTPEELRPIVNKLKPACTLYIVEGGDHSYKVPKKGPVTQDEVYRAVLDEIARWLSQL